MRICIEQVNLLVQQILHEFDQDQDSYLNEKELTKYLQMTKKARGSFQQVTPEEVAEVFISLGASRTKKIGKKELYLAVIKSTVDE